MYVFTVAVDECDDNMLLEQLMAAAEQYERVLTGTVQTGGRAEGQFLHFVAYYCYVQSKLRGWLMYSIRTVDIVAIAAAAAVVVVVVA